MSVREELLDLLERLVTLRDQLGDNTFSQACHNARIAIAATALDHAHRAPGRSRSDQPTVNYAMKE